MTEMEYLQKIRDELNGFLAYLVDGRFLCPQDLFELNSAKKEISNAIVDFQMLYEVILK